MEDAGDVLQCNTYIDTLGREQPRQRKPVSVFNSSKREEHRNNLGTPMAQKPAEEKRPAEKLKKIH